MVVEAATLFAACNQRLVTLDLSQPDGAAVFSKSAADADARQFAALAESYGARLSG